ncbi:MAG: BlaI/MecI/CopY family transcriptional regulator, partial [Gemmatimonadales bacterium]
HVYHARIGREDFGRWQMREIRESVFEGEGVPLVRALIQGARLSPEEIAALRASLDDLDRHPGRIS